MKYRVLELEQGSDAWKLKRFEHCTASQVPVLFDQSPYQTRLGLFEEKRSKREADVSHSKQALFNIGHKAEIAGRDWIEAHLGIKVSPAVLLSTECPDLLASLDGFNAEKRIVFEAKYVGRDALHELKKGKLKAHHESQVQAQLLASGAEKCVYFAMDPEGDAAVIDVYPNLDYAKDIAAAVTKFMKDVREGVEPEASDRDFYTPTDPRFDDLANLERQMKLIKANYDALEGAILDDYKDYKRVKAGGVTIAKYFAKGTVDYGKIPQLKGLDLERYRKAGSERTRVSFKKESA